MRSWIRESNGVATLKLQLWFCSIHLQKVLESTFMKIILYNFTFQEHLLKEHLTCNFGMVPALFMH